MSRLEELGIDQAFVEKFLDRDSVEIGRKAIEDAAIDMRDSRIAVICGNGIVCREKDGSASSVMRMRTDTALMIALRAMLGISQ